jgi:hypothetical protein
MLKNVLFAACIFLTVLSSIQLCSSQSSNQRAQAVTATRNGNPVNAESEVRSNYILDVREYGVDCTFTHDSSAALNAVTATAATNGAAITLPPKCHIKLASTWVVKNLSGFTIKGVSGAGNNGSYGTNVPTITWTGEAGGTMIEMEYVDGFEVTNLAIDGGGLAAVGINVDKTGKGGLVNTTDGIFRRLHVHGNMAGGASNAGWVGLQFSMVSRDNVEDMRILDSTFYCGPSVTSGIAAIRMGPSFNNKGYIIRHNFIHGCTIGVWEQGGSAIIDENEVGSNHIDIQVDFWTDPVKIANNLSESAESGDQFLVMNGTVNHSIEVTANNIPVNDTCAISFLGGTLSAPSGNTFYRGFGGGVSGHKICNRGNNAVALLGADAGFGLNVFDLANFVNIPAGGPHSVIDSAGMSNAQRSLVTSTGSTFLERAVFYNLNDSAAGLGAANQSENSTPCALNSWCGMEGGYEVVGVNSPVGFGCRVTGNDTSAVHSYYISGVDVAGNETILRNSGNASTCHGPASFDGSHYETLTWLASPNAAKYNLYAANPRNPGNQINRIATGIVGTSYRFNGPYPTTWPITGEKNLFNNTLSHIFRGKDMELQFGTPLRGFSDKGVTQTFSLSSKGFQLGGSGSTLSQMTLYSTASIAPSAVRAASCADQTFPLKGATTADRISNLVPPAALGNVSLNGYISARDTLLLHFCNPSGSSATPPAGVYSILAVH